jgi:hypothetical protein
MFIKQKWTKSAIYIHTPYLVFMCLWESRIELQWFSSFFEFGISMAHVVHSSSIILVDIFCVLRLPKLFYFNIQNVPWTFYVGLHYIWNLEKENIHVACHYWKANWWMTPTIDLQISYVNNWLLSPSQKNELPFCNLTCNESKLI